MKRILLIAIFILLLLALAYFFLIVQKPASDNFRSVSTAEFSEIIGSRDVQLVDVRTAEEFAEGHLIGAVNIDFKNRNFIEQACAQLEKDRVVAVYCRSGKRSANAAAQLADKGYEVVNLLGGIIQWQADSFHVEK